jgi:hypothetical protein
MRLRFGNDQSSRFLTTNKSAIEGARKMVDDGSEKLAPSRTVVISEGESILGAVGLDLLVKPEHSVIAIATPPQLGMSALLSNVDGLMSLNVNRERPALR